MMGLGFSNEVELTLFDRDGREKKRINVHNDLTRAARKLLLYDSLVSLTRGVVQYAKSPKYQSWYIPNPIHLFVLNKAANINENTQVAPYIGLKKTGLADESVVGYYSSNVSSTNPTPLSGLDILTERPDQATYGDDWITSCYILDTMEECDIRSLVIGNGIPASTNPALKFSFGHVPSRLDKDRLSNGYFFEYLEETTKIWSGWIGDDSKTTQLVAFDTLTGEMTFRPFTPAGSDLLNTAGSCNCQKLGDLLFEINGGATMAASTNVTMTVRRALLDTFILANGKFSTQTFTVSMVGAELEWPSLAYSAVWSPITVCRAKENEVDIFLSGGGQTIDGVFGYKLYKITAEFVASNLTKKSIEKVGFYPFSVNAPINSFTNSFISKTGFYDYAKKQYWLPTHRLGDDLISSGSSITSPGVVLDETGEVVHRYYTNAHSSYGLLFPIRYNNGIRMYTPHSRCIFDMSDCMAGADFGEVIHKEPTDIVRILYKMELR